MTGNGRLVTDRHGTTYAGGGGQFNHQSQNPAYWNHQLQNYGLPYVPAVPESSSCVPD